MSSGAHDDATVAAPAAYPWGRVALVGAVAGFVSGLLGVGGGVVIVPLLLLLVHAPPKVASATSLGAIVPISVAGVAGYAPAGEVDWPVAACVAVGAVAGAVLGTRLLVWIRPPALQIAFAGVMVITALRMVAGEADPSGRSGLTVALGLGLVVLGLGSGVVAGLLGVGGGVVIVPGLTLLVGVPLVLAKGTSLAVIVPTALSGTLRNRRRGLTAPRPAAVVGAGGVLSALVAARLSLGLDAGISRALFAALLVAVAARLVVLGVRGIRGAPAGPADRGP